MKNLKKVLAVVTAISAMLASVPAFAALDLNEKDAVIDTFTCTGADTTSPSVTAGVAANAVDGGEMTFLILNDGAVVQDIQEEDILYIDQHTVSDDGTSFTGVINLARVGENLSALPVGEYPVRIGYNSKATGAFAIAAATLKVEEDSTGRVVSFILGDVNGADGCNLADANYIIARLSGASASVGGVYSIGQVVADINEKAFTFGDVNGADGCNLADANYIIARLSGATATVGATDGEGNAVAIGGTMSFIVAE